MEGGRRAGASADERGADGAQPQADTGAVLNDPSGESLSAIFSLPVDLFDAATNGQQLQQQEWREVVVSSVGNDGMVQHFAPHIRTFWEYFSASTDDQSKSKIDILYNNVFSKMNAHMQEYLRPGPGLMEQVGMFCSFMSKAVLYAEGVYTSSYNMIIPMLPQEWKDQLQRPQGQSNWIHPLQHGVDVLTNHAKNLALKHYARRRSKATCKPPSLSDTELKKLYYIAGYLISELIVDELLDKRIKKENRRQDYIRGLDLLQAKTEEQRSSLGQYA